MRTIISIICGALLLACDPSSLDKADEESENAPETESPTSAETSEQDDPTTTPDKPIDTGSPATDTAEPDDPSDKPAPIKAGYWRLVWGNVTADDCGLDTWLLNNVFNTMADLYLPEGFQVDPLDGAFDIEADDSLFETPGPITCTLDGESFTCEQQTATAAIGWTYAIDFTGTVPESDLIRGTAVVRYLAVDAYNEGRFEEAGLDHTTCTNTVIMELSWADW